MAQAARPPVDSVARVLADIPLSSPSKCGRNSGNMQNPATDGVVKSVVNLFGDGWGRQEVVKDAWALTPRAPDSHSMPWACMYGRPRRSPERHAPAGQVLLQGRCWTISSEFHTG